MADPLALVRAMWATKLPTSPIYAFLLADIELVSATSGSILARLPLTATHVNTKGGVHGTVSACLVDWAGGMAIASTGAAKTGVSTDIHVSYVASAAVGDVLEIECKAVKVGATMAYTNVEIRRVGDGRVVATGLHTKFVK